MLYRTLVRQSPKSSTRPSKALVLSRTVVVPPSHSRHTILSRNPERPLPPLPASAFRKWATTLPIFLLVIGISAAAIFNYEKSSSSVVNSTLYALRTNAQARELLGDEIYFRDRIPWVWGECNAVRGRINIHFAVKGTKEKGHMKFKSTRQGGRMGRFVTEEWSLEMADGTVHQLLNSNTTEQFQKLPERSAMLFKTLDVDRQITAKSFTRSSTSDDLDGRSVDFA